MSTDERRTEQTEDPTVTINRERLRLLGYIADRRVRHSSASGLDILQTVGNTAGYGSRLGGKVREMWRAGLVVLTPTDFYQLTTAGERRRRQAADEYDAMRITAPHP